MYIFKLRSFDNLLLTSTQCKVKILSENLAKRSLALLRQQFESLELIISLGY